MEYKMIKLLLIDIDGCLTSNKNYSYGKETVKLGYINPNQKEENIHQIVALPHYELNVTKSFNDKDFSAIKLFKVKDVKIHALTGDKWNRQILKDRRIDHTITIDQNGKIEKEKYLEEILLIYRVTKEEVVYVGDDTLDILLMKEVESAYCQRDASLQVKRYLDSRWYKELTGNDLSEDSLTLEDEEVLSVNPYILNRNSGEGIVDELYMKMFGIVTDEDIRKLIQIDAEERQ